MTRRSIYIGMPPLETDDESLMTIKRSRKLFPIWVHLMMSLEYMHNIIFTSYPDEILTGRTSQ
jgi:hypothetical protein